MDEALIGLLLIVLSGFWALVREIPLRAAFSISAESLLLGLVAGGLPLLGVPLLEWRPAQGFPPVRALRRDLRDKLVPTLGRLSATERTGLAVIAAVSEEVFFRGVLQVEVGWILAGVFFGALHPLSLGYIGWATGVGWYLGLLYQESGSLVAPILAHFLLDVGGLWWLRRFYLRQQYAPGGPGPMGD